MYTAFEIYFLYACFGEFVEYTLVDLALVSCFGGELCEPKCV